MMKLIFPALLSVILISCYSSSTKEKEPVQETTPKEVDTAYLRTGFYYLTEANDGIRKKSESDGEVYTLAKTPFASVDNISHTEIKMNKIEDKVYPNFCVQFDEKGTKDFAEGSGNPLHTQIAAVIAGKLVYVVDNRPESKITTGNVCLIMVGISGLELEAMKRAVDKKR
jgi:hypothetical protein